MDAILKKLRKDNIRFDCRYYTGYKPCGLAEFCTDCDKYQPRGTRILIIKLAALGDVLRTTAILPGIKKIYPQSHITWITDPAASPLLQHNHLIDALYIFDTAGILTISRMRFDLALNFEKENRALALTDAISATKKRGFALSDAGTLSIYNDASVYALQLGLNDELKFRHNTKTYQQIIYEMAEIPYAGEEYVLDLPEHSLNFAKEATARFKLNPSRISIGLNTGCGDVFQTKRWTKKGFCELAKLLAQSGEYNILLLGGRRECEFNRSIVEQCNAPIIDTGCHNSLEEFFALISLCDVVVSSDSLAAHIAIALKKQVVIPFGPTCHQEVDLYGRGEKIITDFPCSPCYKKTCEKKPTCMDALEAKPVFDAVGSRINSLKSARA